MCFELASDGYPKRRKNVAKFEGFFLEGVVVEVYKQVGLNKEGKKDREKQRRKEDERSVNCIEIHNGSRRGRTCPEQGPKFLG